MLCSRLAAGQESSDSFKLAKPILKAVRRTYAAASCWEVRVIAGIVVDGSGADDLAGCCIDRSRLEERPAVVAEMSVCDSQAAEYHEEELHHTYAQGEGGHQHKKLW